jgi:hypothetical protein
LSGRGLCDGLITCPKEFIECDREASIMRRYRPTRGCCAMERGRKKFIIGVVKYSPYSS